MTKATVDTLIQNMKKAGVVTKATPWMVEGFGEVEEKENKIMFKDSTTLKFDDKMKLAKVNCAQ